MKIARVQAFEYDVFYAYGEFGMSHGRVATSQRSLVVRVVTDDGRQGWAETCPNGRTYLPSFVEGEREALRLLADAVVGQDPRNLARINAIMDSVLLGGNAAKAVLDIACWDLLGQAAGLPVSELLGGRAQEDFPLFVAVPVGPVDSMAIFVERELALGIRVFQVKAAGAGGGAGGAGGPPARPGPDATVIADANGGWSLQSALLAARQLDGLPVHLEQPCRTMSDCAEVRRHTSLPMILDESVGSIDDLVRAKLVVGAGGVNIKAGRLGGFTKARAFRAVAEGLGMMFTVDDTWGGSVVTAQNAHLAASSHPDHLTAATFYADWTRPHVATGPRMLPSGRGRAPTGPGLGITVDLDLLGPAVIDR